MGQQPGYVCCAFFGIECEVFMVKISYNQKPYRRLMMGTWGTNCAASPSRCDRRQCRRPA